MKILYITSSYPYGFGESFLNQEIEEMLNLGSEIFILPTFGRGSAQKTESASAHITLLDHKLFRIRFIMSFIILFISHPSKLYQVVKKVCFGRDAKGLKNLIIIFKAVHMAKAIKHLEIDHIHCHWAAVSATLAYIISMLSGVKWSMSVHRWDIVENNMFFEKSLSAQFVRYISHSGVMLAKSRNIYRDENAIVIHMGVKLNNFEEVENSYELANGLLSLACVGNFLPVKGHISLLRAVSTLKTHQWHLHLFGSGPTSDSIKNLADVLGVKDKVTFHGQVSHKDLMERYAMHEFDVIIQPSIDLGDGHHEGIPVSLIEAMAFGIPVIATNTGGIPELIGGDCGILVEANMELELASAIDTLFREKEKRILFGKNGKQKVKSEFNIRQTTLELKRMMGV